MKHNSIKLFSLLCAVVVTFSIVMAQSSTNSSKDLLDTSTSQEQGSVSEENRPLTFLDTDYFFRWNKDDLYEFTPEGQEDLTSWNDMLSVVLYPQVDSPDVLEQIAVSLINIYIDYEGHIFTKTSYRYIVF